MKTINIIVFLCLLAMTGTGFATTITIQTNSSNCNSTYGNQNTPTTNNDNTFLYMNNNSGGWEQHGYVCVYIPVFSGTVSSANLTPSLISTTTDPSGANNLSIFSMTRGFIEPQATWNVNQTGSNWTTAGGDYNPTLIDTVAIRAATRNAGNMSVVLHLIGPTNKHNMTITPGSRLCFMLISTGNDDIGVYGFAYTSNISKTPKLVIAYDATTTTTTHHNYHYDNDYYPSMY